MFLVGGAVRDSLLHLPVKDRDWVVIGATPKDMLEQGFQQVGKDFPVFLHPCSREEYALARTERKNGNGYTGFITWSAPDVTIEQDLQRRDLTINAIAQNENGEFVDPYGGQYDLLNRVLRHVSLSFNEDPLRVLRVARFAARFAHLNFRIAEETLTLMTDMATSGELLYLTAERVWKETEKALLTSNPQVYFQVLYDCNALHVLFPEINELYKISTSIKWYPEININIGIHSLMALAFVTVLSDDSAVRFATLLHDVRKAIIVSKKLPNHDVHHNIKIEGVSIVENLCQRLKVPNQIRNLALIAVEFCNIVHTIKYKSAEEIVNLFERIGAWRKPQRVEQLIIICEADFRSSSIFENIYYSQGNYLRKAFLLAQTVKTKDIISDGFQGKKIRKELIRRRILAINYGLINH